MREESEGQEPLDPNRPGKGEDGFTFHKKSQETDDETLDQIEEEKGRDAEKEADE